MAELLQQGIGRVRGSPAEPVAGSAFLISAGHVMTCAHVVNAGLGRPWNAVERPGDDAWVQVEFPFARHGLTLSASVIEWRPPGDGIATDIAILELERQVLESPYRTIAGLPHRGQTFWTKGFPVGQDGGMDAVGELGTPIEHGRLLAHGSARPGFFIEGGFSGAPLLDETTNAVIGMINAAARDDSKRTAFVIPADQLELAWPPLARPYKGLNAFREVDRRFFFGRNVFADELAAKLALRPFVAVVGRSGSGKSSLVRAGLLPRLHDEGSWRVLVVRPGAPSADPFRNIACCLLDAARSAGTGLGAMLDEDAVARLATALHDDPDVLVDHLRRLAGDGPDSPSLLLVVDQFEELFTLVADPHEDDESSVRARCVRCLCAAVDTTHTQDPAARCIVTLRADYLGRALGIRALADLLKDADIKLAPMNAAELRAAIEEPARMLGVRFDDGLVDELMHSVGDSHDALPLLEFALAELWSMQRDRVVRRPAQPNGEAATDVMVTSLTRHADAVFDHLSRRFGEATFRAAMTALVWLGDPAREGEDTRRVGRRGEFVATGEEGVRRWALLEQLASQDRHARLVTMGASQIDGEPTAEIVHDALMRRWGRLRGWLDEDRGFLLWQQKTNAEAAEWRQSRDVSDLLVGRKLAEAQRWREERPGHDLLLLTDYLTASMQFHEQQEEQARLRQLEHIGALEQVASVAKRRTKHAMLAAVLALLAAIVAILGLGWGAAQKQIAAGERVKALRAQVTRLGAAAEGQTEFGDPVTGMLLALEALHIAPNSSARGFTAEAERALTHALQMQRETSLVLGHLGAVHSVAFSSDGKRLASASDDGSVRVWDVATSRAIGAPLMSHDDKIWSVTFSPDGRRLATGSEDQSVRLWDAETGQQIGVPLPGHTGIVWSVAFSPDGRRLASASSDQSVRLWDAATGQPIGESLIGHTNWIRSVAFSPDGKRLASASFDRTVRLWDAATGQSIGPPLLGHRGWVLSVAFSPDGRRLASASADKSVRLWDPSTGQPIGSPLLGHADTVWSVAFSPDSKLLASASSDQSVRLWDAETGRPIGGPLLGHAGTVWSAMFSPDGKQLASASDDRTVRLWNAEPEGPINTLLVGHTGTVWSVAFSPDGKRLASASADQSLRLWDGETGRLIGDPLLGHTGAVLSVAFSPDNSVLASASADRSIRLWDANTGRQKGAPLIGHIAAVQSVAFSPDGKRLASGSWDKSVRLWDVESGRPNGLTLLGHTDSVNSVAFSPDGKRLASASADKSVRLWDTATGHEVVAPLLGHTDSVRSVAFSPDGKRLATASSDHSVRLWDVATGQPVVALLLGHTAAVWSVVFSPDGGRLASASEDQTVRLWDAATGRPISPPLVGHAGGVYSVAFSPDGRRLASASLDQSVRLWPTFISRDEAVETAEARLPHCLSPYQRMTFGLSDPTGSDVPDNHATKPPCW